MKKLITLLICAITCITMGVVLIGCENKAPVTLVDFPATATDSVVWGEEYSLRRVVEDEEGKTYSLAAVVKTTKENKEVAVISGKFQATDLYGYEIAYSAKITEKYTATSVVTLSVVPEEVKSVILPEVTQKYKSGDSITIPEAKVNDVYEGEIGTAAVKSISYVESADGNEIALDKTLKTYTPAYSGKLTVVYGYEGVEDKTLVIEVDVARVGNSAVAFGKDALLDFAQKSDKTKMVWDAEGGYIVYSAKADGLDTGYANIDFKSVARQNVDALKGEYDYLHVRVNPRRTKENQNRAKVIFFNSGEINDYLYDEPTTNGANPKRCAFNEWSDIYIPVKLINTNAGMFITAEFNKASNNYDGMTEMWLTGFDFVKNAQYTVDYVQEKPQGDMSDISLAVGTDRADGIVAPHIVKVYNAAGEEVTDGVVNGNVWSANVPAGKYSYTVTTADAEYICMNGIYKAENIGGEFTVNSALRIVLPTVSEGTAGTAIAIPAAKVVDYYEEEKGSAVVGKIKYTEWDGTVIDNIASSVKEYVPNCSGTLTVTYEYEGAVAQTLNIAVGVNRSGNTAVASGKDAVLDFVQKSDKTKLLWNEEGGYVVYAAKEDGLNTGYANIDFSEAARKKADELKGEYDYLHVRVNPRRTKENQNRAKVIFFNSGDINNYLYDEPTTNGANPKRCAFNEWSDIYIPVNLINTNAGMFITAEFNKASNNYDGMTEMWLTGFDFVKNAQYTVDYEQEKPQGDMSNITLTVSTERADGVVAPHTVKVYNAAGKEVTDGVVDGNVWSANVPAGRYTYMITSADAEYICMDGIYKAEHVGGEFTVNKFLRIILPTVSEGTAGTAISIPVAKVVDYYEEEKGNAIVKEIKYTELDGTVISNIENSASKYMPNWAGTLSVTYGYEDAEDVTLEITVNPNREGRVFGEGKDALHDVTYSNDQARMEYDETNGWYVFKPTETATAAGITFWTDIFVSDAVKAHVNAVKDEYDYLHFRINLRQPSNLFEGVARPEWLARIRLFQGKTNDYLYGADNGSYEDIDRFAFNEWCDIYVPTKLVDFDASLKQLLSGQFFRNNSGQDYFNMTEMWIDGLDFVKTADLNETKLNVTAATADGTTTLTVANGMPEGEMVGYTLHVYQGTNAKVEVTGTLANNVWTATGLAAGTYTYKIKVTNPKYVFINEDQSKVTEYITGTFTVAESSAPNA